MASTGGKRVWWQVQTNFLSVYSIFTPGLKLSVMKFLITADFHRRNAESVIKMCL
jgi:hypothetical protein